VLPEEVALRSPADLPLQILERLARDLEGDRKLQGSGAGKARSAAMEAVHSAKRIRDPLARLRKGFEGIEKSSELLGRVLLAVVENLDSVLFLGGSGRRQKRDPLLWALRDRLQESSHLMLIASAPSTFGAVAYEGSAFYGFFLPHRLQEMHNDEVLDLVRRRLEDESKRGHDDPTRFKRIEKLLERFDSISPNLRGLLVLAGGIPRFAHLICEVLIDANLSKVQKAFNSFLDELTPFFQQRLDPRLLPESEIDLLHELASSWGPMQPTELTDLLYGVSLNEVGVLLRRLDERGMVERSGSPGGRAVTWDLTEPLYRVWTHFRTEADGGPLFQVLVDFIALLYSESEIGEERERIARELSGQSMDDSFRVRIETDMRLFDTALEQRKKLREKPERTPNVFYQSKLVEAGKSKAKDSIHAVSNSGTEVRSILELLINALDAEDTGRFTSALDKVRDFHSRNLEEKTLRHVLSAGIVIALSHAKDEDDLDRRDALLDELRGIFGRWTEDAEVRKHLSVGLTNTLIDAKDEENLDRRDALLDELRDLAGRWTEDAEVRKQLAMGLVNTLVHAKNEENLDRRDALLDELRELAGRWNEDADVRKQLAMGLVNTLIHAKGEENLNRRDALLDELRDLTRHWTEDTEVRERLARGLFIALNQARNEEDLDRRDALLDELRDLAGRWTEDAKIRESLARGLFNTLNQAKGEEDLDRRDALLDELRDLTRHWTEDTEVRKRLAMGLFNTLNQAKNEENLDRRDALLDELRDLAGHWTEDAKVRKRLAMGLSNTLINAKGKENLDRRDALLDELRDLARRSPEDLEVQTNLARALLMTIKHGAAETNPDKLDALYNELSILMRSLLKGPMETVFRIGTGLLRISGPAVIRVLEGIYENASEEMAGILHPFILAAKTLIQGEGKALAREPKEMRRVVHLLLEKTGHLTKPDE
jgi:hypothetical protein